jgi:hypothetical protein
MTYNEYIRIMDNRKSLLTGVIPDPFNENIIATYSDSALQPIKIWDLRKGSSSKAKLTIFPHDKDIIDQNMSVTPNPNTTVTDVAWSQCRPHILAVTTSHLKEINFYNTSTHNKVSTRFPVHTITVNDIVKCLSWQCPPIQPSGTMMTLSSFASTYDRIH